MINRILKFIKKIKSENEFNYDDLMLSIGQIRSKQNQNVNELNINNYEFKVFSQWGEDGIIDYLVSNLDIKNETFIEFGVENYQEANTKFLLLNKNWNGVILDSSQSNINHIKEQEIYWRYNLNADCQFITKENINEILKKYNSNKKVGLLSIDIDGNDYWVWKEINQIDPDIVIIEYNARLGKEKSYVVPYEKNFNRKEKHFSMIYYGASISALDKLAKEKGYAFICCNKAGNNAFFVKKTLLNDKVREQSIDKGFYKNKFREARNVEGNLAFYDEKKEQDIIFKLPLLEV